MKFKDFVEACRKQQNAILVFALAGVMAYGAFCGGGTARIILSLIALYFTLRGCDEFEQARD